MSGYLNKKDEFFINVSNLEKKFPNQTSKLVIKASKVISSQGVQEVFEQEKETGFY